MLERLRDGYAAVVIGASGGIGSAVLAALEADPRCGRAVGVSRASHPGFDMTDPNSIVRLAEELSAELGEIDLVFDATGALVIDGRGPEKSIRAIDAQAFAAQFALNATGPALLLQAFAPLLPRSRPAIFATLSAKVGSIGDNRLGGWIAYRAAKAALNQIVRTAAIELARSHRESLVVALHPGTVATALSASYRPAHEVLSPEASASALLATLSGLTPAETGGFFAYDGTALLF